MIIIGIAGKRGSGKSSLASIFSAKHGFRDLPFAAPLKAGVRRDFNLQFAHTDGTLKETKLFNGHTPRELMINYGAFFRNIDPEYWVKQVFQEISVGLDLGVSPKFTISDVRFPNEVKAIKEVGGFLIRLNRASEFNSYTSEAFEKDPSECALDSYQGWDLLVSSDSNKTPKDLEVIADFVMGKVGQ